MTFHSKSVVDFGQLLNGLMTSLTNGSPIPVALEVVRGHFAARVVLLSISYRGGGRAFFANRGHKALAEDSEAYDGSTALRALMEQYQHIAASECGDTGNAEDYSLWVFRDRDAPRFDNEETALAGVLVAQIARALDLASRIESGATENALYSETLDRLNVGVITIDADGRTASISAVAERFLSAHEGLQIRAGKLRAVATSEDQDLQAALRAAFDSAASGESGASRGLSLTKRSGARTLGILVRPVTACSAGCRPLVAVYVRDCDAVPEVESEFVRQIFDLTPAEAAVTGRLTAGLSLEAAAASLAISRNTARAHLRSIFSKSGITRQTELVRLVLNSAVILGERPQQAA